MPVHQGPLRIGEASRLGEDLDRDFHLADIVEQSGDAEGPYVARRQPAGLGEGHRQDGDVHRMGRDRKSTRLNSSHLVISYAVFCLKKKTTASNYAAISPA